MRLVRDFPNIRSAGLGPYLSDINDQPFRWPVTITDSEVSFSDPVIRFGVNVFWDRPGREPLWVTCDNAGAYYDPGASAPLSLARELVRSQLARNRATLERYQHTGYTLERSIQEALEVAESLGREAELASMPVQSEAALSAAIDAADSLELAFAWSRPVNASQRVGCDARQMFVVDPDRFREHFRRVFDYATVTFYPISVGMEDFEPTERNYRFGLRDLWISWLEHDRIVIEGRPLLWFHTWVTPHWLARKTPEQLRHRTLHWAEDVVGRYRGRIQYWEVLNEAHDWANRLNLSHAEMIDIARYACQVTQQVNPTVVRIINNTDPFGTYARHGKREDGVAVERQWTPYTFLRDLIAADVPFEEVGIQIYRPYRSLADIVRLIERFESLGKPVNVTEVGVPGAADGIHTWTPESQGAWAERIFSVLVSRPNVAAVLWYDFADPGAFLPSGGLVDAAGLPKHAYRRLEQVLVKTGRIPSEGPRVER
jgi:endo-1,4-beta-xylanase